MYCKVGFSMNTRLIRKDVITCIKKNPFIQKYWIFYAKLNVERTKMLANAIRESKVLSEILLHGVFTSKENLITILRAIQANTRIKSLGVRFITHELAITPTICHDSVLYNTLLNFMGGNKTIESFKLQIISGKENLYKDLSTLINKNKTLINIDICDEFSTNKDLDVLIDGIGNSPKTPSIKEGRGRD